MVVYELRGCGFESICSHLYFIGCNDDGVIRSLFMKLPQMIGYVKCFESNKTMSFKATDKKMLKQYTEIWKRVSSLMNTEIES